MPIEMPKGLPFSVDTFSPASKKKRHHFLTHAHKDHSAGISAHFQYPIYCTHLTKSLLLLYCPQLEQSLFVDVEVGQTLVIRDPDGEFTVTAFDANHCPGAVMFLFEGDFGTILHTGDCRLTPECIRSLPEKHVGRKGKEPRRRLDYIFLDCTFGKFSEKLPSKHSAIRQVISCIWKHPEAPSVYLTCDLLGQEEILAAVSTTFGSKIFVDKAHNPEWYNSLMLTVPQILSDDPSSRFHIFDGYSKLYERAAAKLAEARAIFQPEPLIIRASAQWYACKEEYSKTASQRKLKFNEAVRDPFGVWHVCYSMHSSREELEWALQLLAPKRVISTTPTCWAMELGYVRKHCFSDPITADDPLWKLLDISADNSVKLDIQAESSGCGSSVEGEPPTAAESKLEVAEKYSRSKEVSLLNFSPPSKRSPVTLFGRARFSLEDSCFSCEETTKEGLAQTFVSNKKQELLSQEVEAQANGGNEFENGKCKEEEVSKGSLCSFEEKITESMKNESAHMIFNEAEQELSRGAANAGLNCKNKIDQVENKLEIEFRKNPSLHSSDGATESSFDEGLRKLYRSRNVPVPRPLPSLVELMNATKRAKRMRRFEF